MYKHLIGKQSIKVRNVVERGAVKKFASAIGYTHPIYIDREVGKKSRYNQNIAPPTFPRVFDYGKVEGMTLPSKGLIHGEQSYIYTRPLLVEEEILCYLEVKDYYEKTGKNGSMGFLVLAANGDDFNENNIFTSIQIVIISETVRKGLRV